MLNQSGSDYGLHIFRGDIRDKQCRTFAKYIHTKGYSWRLYMMTCVFVEEISLEALVMEAALQEYGGRNAIKCFVMLRVCGLSYLTCCSIIEKIYDVVWDQLSLSFHLIMLLEETKTQPSETIKRSGGCKFLHFNHSQDSSFLDITKALFSYKGTLVFRHGVLTVGVRNMDFIKERMSTR